MNRTSPFSNRPLIGVTTRNRNDEGDFVAPGRYVDAIRAAGGIPVLFPPGESEPQVLLSWVDGLVLTGGGDLCPSTFRGSGTESLHFRLFQAFVQAALRFSPRLAGLLPNPEPVPQVA